MVNFAIGLGSFLDGMNQGMSAARTVMDARDERRMRKITKEATGAATEAREADISKGIATETDDLGNVSFSVGGKGYADAASARAASEAQVGSFMDYYRSKTVPKLIEGYIQMGEPQKAAALESYLDSENGKANSRDWARASQRFAMGDVEGGLKGLAKLNERLDNGVDIVGYDPITEPTFEERKDEKTGKTTRVETGTQPTGGWRVRWKDSGSGKEFTQDFESADDFARTALWATSPENQVLATINERTAAQNARAKAAADEAEDRRSFGYDVAKANHKAVIDDRLSERDYKRRAALAGVTHSYDMERDAASIQLRAALKVSDDTGEDPEDVRKSIETISKSLRDNDISGEFGRLPLDQQTAKAVEILTKQRAAARGVIEAGAPSGGRGVIPPLY